MCKTWLVSRMLVKCKGRGPTGRWHLWPFIADPEHQHQLTVVAVNLYLPTAFTIRNVLMNSAAQPSVTYSQDCPTPPSPSREPFAGLDVLKEGGSHLMLFSGAKDAGTVQDLTLHPQIQDQVAPTASFLCSELEQFRFCASLPSSVFSSVGFHLRLHPDVFRSYSMVPRIEQDLLQVEFALRHLSSDPDSVPHHYFHSLTEYSSAV